jgi:ion channel-forming bestrophin family protein
MVDYNPKEWIRYIFYFQKADTVRKLAPLILSIGVYSLIVCYFLLIEWKVGQDTDLKNISLMHSLLGFVISMLLVFRTNTAYDRWWEGRRQWGALMNSSRNLALKTAGLLNSDLESERAFYREMIPTYAFTLKNHLRGKYLPDEMTDAPYIDKTLLRKSYHAPNEIAAAIFAKTIDLQQKGILLPEHVLILNTELETFTNVCGACERIKNTPIPLSYSSFIKKFIFTYCLTLPIGYVFSLHFLVVPFVMFVFYVLASLEVIAEEIEDPFGEDTNDLPIDRICLGIKASTRALLI